MQCWFVRKASNKKRWQIEAATEARSESAGQQLSLEEQERASLGRIRDGLRGQTQRRLAAPRNRPLSTAMN
jgi:hypothetical protein